MSGQAGRRQAMLLGLERRQFGRAKAGFEHGAARVRGPATAARMTVTVASFPRFLSTRSNEVIVLFSLLKDPVFSASTKFGEAIFNAKSR